MSTFEVNIKKISNVEKHPDADKLTIVSIDGYKCIANLKDDGTFRYNTGDYAVYIPEDAVLPDELLKFMGFWDDTKGKGTLAGSSGNRVKAIRLRGVVSQGLLMPVEVVRLLNFQEYMSNGAMIVHLPNERNIAVVDPTTNIADNLGIHKYVPEIPVAMAGEVDNYGTSNTVKYDIENIQKYPDVFKEDEYVYVTEKLHGTLCCVAYNALTPDEFYTYSKGLGNQGLVMKNNDKNKNNVYVRQLNMLRGDMTCSRIKSYAYDYGFTQVHVFGEIFGKGVQDLSYGQIAPTFRVFDVFVKGPTVTGWIIPEALSSLCHYLQLDMVPLLYFGEFSMDKMIELRDGNTMMTNQKHIREGIVIRADSDQRDTRIGRKILKFVSPDYLTRKGNTTEYN